MAKTLYSEHNVLFLKMLKVLRESKKLKQRDLAKLIGHSQAMVSKVECGGRRLDVMELRAWLAALGTDFTEFMNSLDAELRLHGVADAQLRQITSSLTGQASSPTEDCAEA